MTIVTTCTQNKIHYTSTLKNKIYAIKLTKTKTCMYKEKAAILKYRNQKYLSEVQLNKINKYKNIHAEINAEQEAQLLQTDCMMAGWPRIQ